MRTLTVDPIAIAARLILDARKWLRAEDFDLLYGGIRSRSILEHVLPNADVMSHEYQGHIAATFFGQLPALFKKNSDWGLPRRQLREARSNFERAETLCKITNKRLDYYWDRPERLSPSLSAAVSGVRKVISQVLGDHGAFLRELPELMRVTSGASEQANRRRALPYLKMRKTISCTPLAVPYVTSMVQFYTGRDVPIRTTVFNRLAVVPKNIKTHRTIGAEPEGCLPFQLAADSFIKRRLKSCLSIDLSDQTRNQAMAKRGSITDDLATIDMTMASDTLADNLVSYLFPLDWERYLRAHRSPFYKGIFGTGKYQKFSSMGNGFTFTVETLVFSAICEALKCHEYTVYGDDVIIPTSKYEQYVRVLRFFGFKVNEAKSYRSGPFRESCGGDYYKGIDVRPVFLKGNQVMASQLSNFINRLVSKTEPEGKVWEYCRHLVEKHKLPIVPQSSTFDNGIHVPVTLGYSMKLIRFRSGMLFVKQLQHVDRSRSRVTNVKALLLWHMLKIRSTEPEVSSVSSFGTVTCAVRRTNWHPPLVMAPPHLYWWGDYLSQKVSASK